jgi:hypothetical protein
MPSQETSGSPSSPRGASDTKGANTLSGAGQIFSVSNRRSPFLLLHKLSIQRQHMQKQEIRAERRSQAILRKKGLIASQMARLTTSLGLSGCEASNCSPPQFRVPSSDLQELKTRNPQPKTHLKEVRYRY